MNIPKYFAPETIEEACSLLSEHKDNARVIAGGTDLLLKMRQRDLLPEYIVNIKNIPELNYITHDKEKGLSIGALATFHSIEASPLIREKFGILAQSAKQMGTMQIRNQATIGGNVCNAASSADLIPALMVLGARVNILSAGDVRTVPIEEFFIGPGQTVLKPHEIAVGFRVPNPLPRSGGVYIKHTIRKALDLAIIGVAVLVALDGDVFSEVKIALGTVAPTPIRARGAEDILKGQIIDEKLIEKAAQTASDESSPRDSMRSSAEYRRKMLKVLVGRAVGQAIELGRAG